MTPDTVNVPVPAVGMLTVCVATEVPRSCPEKVCENGAVELGPVGLELPPPQPPKSKTRAIPTSPVVEAHRRCPPAIPVLFNIEASSENNRANLDEHRRRAHASAPYCAGRAGTRLPGIGAKR